MPVTRLPGPISRAMAMLKSPVPQAMSRISWTAPGRTISRMARLRQLRSMPSDMMWFSLS